ncbi:MAG: radical SAM protein [bacterium]
MDFVPIIKPVGGSCNLNCLYCYFQKRKISKSNKLITEKNLLKRFIDNTCSIQERTEFIWHGGEPLLSGLEFYHNAIELQSKWAKMGKKIYNSIQTNGTLVNQKWIDFFTENNFATGVSLDGPAEFHNKSRGKFEQTIKAIQLLKEANVISDVICCVSTINCKYPEKIFDFFKEKKIKKIKFLQVQGRNKNGDLLPYSVNSLQYADFLIKIFKKWIKTDDPEIEIREIKSIVNLMLGGDFRECMFAGECYKYFTVYPDGSIYGCDSFPKIKSLYFGHIDQNLTEIELSINFKRFKQKLKKIQQKCKSCYWFKICRGGCPQDWHPDIFKKNPENAYCSGLQKIFSTIQKTLKEFKMI